METRIVPDFSPLTAPYWQACARGELRLQRCRDCGLWVHFPESVCRRCASENLDFEPVAGTGVVETFTVVHRSFVPGYSSEVPYVLAWILLPEQEGLRVFGNVVDVAAADVRIAMPVEVRFEQIAEFDVDDQVGSLPVFAPIR
ncbi:Zn-ribbon domain-containing OB-fold protein [Rhodococcus sp. 077-4]|uniref:Zn-ribbon domain-containing OB-fold protein n=1 Tax=Rhodococcus sp. 077-4 TaxID=2789271 RepID=UPI0039F63379